MLKCPNCNQDVELKENENTGKLFFVAHRVDGRLCDGWGKVAAKQSVQSGGAFCPVCDIQPTSEGICPKCRRVVRRRR